jgi:Arc/MetJ-type ribon-helix-helix transcriptional regulator
MRVSVTARHRNLLRKLLRTGYWNSESEIIHFGVRLVAKELEHSRQRNLDPYPPGLLSAAYRKLGEIESAEDRALANASALPSAEELG